MAPGLNGSKVDILESGSIIKSISIILISIVASICYGIIHDQITARICVEYFTIGHPIIIPTRNPTTLGILWGIIATWWVGAILGVLLAIAARAGERPKRSVTSLLRPIAILLAVTGCCAAAAGCAGYMAAENQWVWLVPPMSERVPESAHTGFLVDLWVHSASYLAAFVGAVVLIVSVWRSRSRLPLTEPADDSNER